jgi:hypothetical protein
MLFSELYSAYYNAVAAVLTEAVSHPVSDAALKKIIEKHAFAESIVSIPTALKEERWPLLKSDGTTPIQAAPTLPLSILQKRWLKAVACDPRIRLFGNAAFDFPDVDPLFLLSDVIVFDKYNDGDPYEDEAYIANFQLILDALKNKYPLRITTWNRKGKPVCQVVLPQYLEYSEKDDKFRLIGSTNSFDSIINLGRIIRCKPYKKPIEIAHNVQPPAPKQSVVFVLTDRRNALERVLLHFAHFEKTAEKTGDDTYTVTIYYNQDDETEIVIRILSFGPMLKVTAPQNFVDLIKQRLLNQKKLQAITPRIK